MQVRCLTVDGQAFKAQQLIMCQDRQPAEAPVPLSSLQPKGKPVSNAEVDSLANTEAIGEAAMVGTREGDDILPWCLYHASYLHAYMPQMQSDLGQAKTHF